MQPRPPRTWCDYARTLLLCLAALVLASCSKEPLFTSLPATARAALQPADSAAPASVVIVMPANNKRGQINLQVGTANQAQATGTNKAGQKADDGANGGHAEQRAAGTPLWVLIGLVLAGGIWAFTRWGPRPRLLY
jgi:hypothetical protein